MARGLGGSGVPHEAHRSIRETAESIRRELKAWERRGGSAASFRPAIKRAHRFVRRGEYERALEVLRGIEGRLRQRLSTKVV